MSGSPPPPGTPGSARSVATLRNESSEREAFAPGEPIWLLVLDGARVSSRAIASGASLVVGRGEACDVVLDAPHASRKHLRIDVGAGEAQAVTLTDLGSANGTTVRGRKLEKGETMTLLAGDAIEVGGSRLVVVPRPPTSPIAPASHAHFVDRLTDRLRDAAKHPPFAVLRVRFPADQPPAAIEEVIAEATGGGALVASYSASEYEVLIDPCEATVAAKLAGAIETTLRTLKIAAIVGHAVAPRAGTHVDQVLGQAAPPSARAKAPEARPSSPLSFGFLAKVEPTLERVGKSGLNVLVVGETGVGKEIITRRIHELSPRANAPLLALNCAAFSESLLESELFGYERGAFTGATTAKPGLLESAGGGTVFLDEIGEMDVGLQAKLLRVLEQREVQRLGALRPKPIDVRFIAATNRGLQAAIERGTFRQDLYFRLAGFVVEIPPLRERRDEILPLAEIFAAEIARAVDVVQPMITDDARDVLYAHDWPGNIRELRNVIERAVVLSEGGQVTAQDLPLLGMRAGVPSRPSFSNIVPMPSVPIIPMDRATMPSLEEVATWVPPAVVPSFGLPRAGKLAPEDERALLVRVLEQCGGNQTHAARLLNVSRRTLIARLDTYKLPRPRKP